MRRNRPVPPRPRTPPPADAAKDRRIVRKLARWFAVAARDLPWRTRPRDPYRTLVSEFMLQQTQVSRVLEKFEPFLERFPSVRELAAANDQAVAAAWSGLGYYRRARNLHATARAIAGEHGGRVPETAAALARLPGIGRYTAGAIASIVFGEAAPIVDGNVTRVVLRVQGQDLPQDAPSTAKLVWQRAADLVACAARMRGHGMGPGVLNEALMELGATICVPRAPRCGLCPIREECRAFELGVQDRIPRPKAAAAQKRLYCASVLVRDGGGRTLVERRGESGLWAGLWQAPTLESPDRAPTRTMLEAWLGVGPLARSETFRFGTTHRDVRFVIWEGPMVAGRAKAGLTRRRTGALWLTAGEIAAMGVSSPQRRILLGSPER